MCRTVSRLALFAAVSLGLLLVTVLTPDTGSAHDVDACRGRSTLVPYAGDWYHYSSRSICPENWDTIGTAAFLIRFQDEQFEPEGPIGGFLGWDIREDSSWASMKGALELTYTDRCYLIASFHSAYNFHATIPPRDDL